MFKTALKLEALIVINVFIVVFLFDRFKQIITTFNNSNTLNNITKEEALKIEESVQYSLEETKQKSSLERASVFFYTNNYNSRTLFSSNNNITKETQSVSSDSFYSTMLSYHQNGLCYIKNTELISQTSDLYSILSSRNEIQENLFYISCPIYSDNVLLGYLGGLSDSKDSLVAVDTTSILYATKNIEKIFN